MLKQDGVTEFLGEPWPPRRRGLRAWLNASRDKRRRPIGTGGHTMEQVPRWTGALIVAITVGAAGSVEVLPLGNGQIYRGETVEGKAHGEGTPTKNTTRRRSR